MKKRVFLAVHVPEEVKRELRHAVEEMRRRDPRAPIRWVNEDGTHITLHFLGDRDEEAIARIGRIVREAAREYRPTTYRLADVGFFPDARRPRIITVLAKEREGTMLESLREKLGKRLEQMGIEVDRRPWRPHVTLGRVKAPGPRAEPYASVKIRPIEFTVSSIDLTESRLDPSGAIYEVLERFPVGISLHGTSDDS